MLTTGLATVALGVLALAPRLPRLARRYDAAALAPIDGTPAEAADSPLRHRLDAWVAKGAGHGATLLPWSRPAVPTPLANRLAILDAGRILVQGTPREVIAAHIEPQVVEVFGDWKPGGQPDSGAAAWAAAHAGALSRRCEISGETAFCYTDDAAPLLAHLAHQPGLRSLHRPANLEDVFLKLTGRELRD